MKKWFLLFSVFAVICASLLLLWSGNRKKLSDADSSDVFSGTEAVTDSISAFTADEGEETKADLTAEAAVIAGQTAGAFLISIDSLRSDQVSFIRPASGIKIELLARLGDDGKVKAALGTCQSCNGSPLAYYKQVGELLRCNNCGQTFPLSVLDTPGGGCHPIMIDASVITETDSGLLVDMELLGQYEPLFNKVADH